MSVGDSYENIAPYQGEGEVIIATLPNSKGWFKTIRACCTKYPSLNGMVEVTHIEGFLENYKKIS